MKASIIVPVYNVKPWISDCINSIKEQTFKDFECIVVDDDSNDGSYEACIESIQGDERFRVFHQLHSELSAARNYGLSFAFGEYVWWVDSDDILKPTCIESSLRFMEDNKLQMTFFNCEVLNCNSNKDVFLAESNYHTRKMQYNICSGPEMLSQMVKNNDFNYAVFLQCIRRDCIKKLYLDRLPAQDMLYTIQNLLLQNKVGHLPEKLYVKRSRDGSAVSSKMTFEKAYGTYRTLTALLNWIEAEHIDSQIGPEAMTWLECWMDKMADAMPLRWKDVGKEKQECLNSLPFKDKWLYRQLIGENHAREING